MPCNYFCKMNLGSKVIGLISALEVVGVSYYLIPRIGIFGAALA
ncbi:hypothetical protein [Saccharolobus islandicus]|nr:hypothetical protein [Sulfolobus islandicus]